MYCQWREDPAVNPLAAGLVPDGASFQPQDKGESFPWRGSADRGSPAAIIQKAEMDLITGLLCLHLHLDTLFNFVFYMIYSIRTDDRTPI